MFSPRSVEYENDWPSSYDHYILDWEARLDSFTHPFAECLGVDYDEGVAKIKDKINFYKKLNSQKGY